MMEKNGKNQKTDKINDKLNDKTKKKDFKNLQTISTKKKRFSYFYDNYKNIPKIGVR